VGSHHLELVLPTRLASRGDEHAAGVVRQTERDLFGIHLGEPGSRGRFRKTEHDTRRVDPIRGTRRYPAHFSARADVLDELSLEQTSLVAKLEHERAAEEPLWVIDFHAQHVVVALLQEDRIGLDTRAARFRASDGSVG
jgi:hypothetical protein